jgi:hypothetical protein
MVLEQWIVIGANPLWPALTRSGIVEHTAERWTIDIRSVDSKANNPARVLIHHYLHLVAFQQNRFAMPDQSPDNPGQLVGNRNYSLVLASPFLKIMGTHLFSWNAKHPQSATEIVASPFLGAP